MLLARDVEKVPELIGGEEAEGVSEPCAHPHAVAERSHSGFRRTSVGAMATVFIIT